MKIYARNTSRGAPKRGGGEASASLTSPKTQHCCQPSAVMLVSMVWYQERTEENNLIRSCQPSVFIIPIRSKPARNSVANLDTLCRQFPAFVLIYELVLNIFYQSDPKTICSENDVFKHKQNIKQQLFVFHNVAMVTTGAGIVEVYWQ